MKRLILVLGLSLAVVRGEAGETLRLVQTIALPNVEGRIDHLAVDVKGQRLFIAALGNNTVEVVDLAAGKWVQTITGLREPQGVAYVAALDRLYVASGGDDLVRVFTGRTYTAISKITALGDADNARFDPAAQQVFVGYGNGALAVLDARDARHVGDLKLAGHPEAFVLEQRGRRILVNLPSEKQIAVVDRDRGGVIAHWTLEAAAGNYPLAFDEANHRLFVGCRSPAKLIVLETVAGKEVASLVIDGDTDDVFYDAPRKRIYISCGGGLIDVIEQVSPDQYHLLAKITTASGARTSLFVPELDRLYLAVPHRGKQAAEIRVFAPQ